MSMKLEIPSCPNCGGGPKGTADTVSATALLNKSEDGIFDYAGETEVFWDGQVNRCEEPGRIRLVCGGCDSEWDSAFTEVDISLKQD